MIIGITRGDVVSTGDLSSMFAGTVVGSSLTGFVNAIIADDAPHIQAIRGNG